MGITVNSTVLRVEPTGFHEKMHIRVTKLLSQSLDFWKFKNGIIDIGQFAFQIFPANFVLYKTQNAFERTLATNMCTIFQVDIMKMLSLAILNVNSLFCAFPGAFSICQFVSN